MFADDAYVPEAIEPVTGIDSCNKDRVVVLSLFKNVLKKLAIFHSYFKTF